MSGIRSIGRSNSNPPEEVVAQGDMFRMADEVFGYGDPNESYELRDMVAVASSYFDRGMIDDADEMLQEALAAGYSRSDAVELNQRIRAIRGDAPAMTTAEVQPPAEAAVPAAVADDEAPAEPPPMPARPIRSVAVSDFTRPLPGADSQPLAVRRLIVDAESDIVANRLESAFDATMYALGLAPSYLPLYIRLAELQLAMGYEDSAGETIETMQEMLNNWSDDDDWLSLSMRVILDPDDTSTLVKLARVLLDQRGTMQLEPFVPEAIQRALAEDPPTALELARDYARLRPADDHAVRLHLRSVMIAGTDDEVSTALTRDVHATSPADLLFARSALAYAESQGAWFRWLERTVFRLLANPREYDDMPRAIEVARRMLPATQHGLMTAIIRVAAKDYRAALDSLAGWSGPVTRETGDPKEHLLAACARAFSTRAISPIESIQELSKAVGEAVVIDVRPFAESSKLFAHPISAEALMQELVSVAKETGQQDLAILHLQALRDRLPEHLEIRTGLADLQVAAGRIAEGVRELRYIAERYEQAGNLDKMVDAMRHISNAVPNNAEMKLKLIEGYVQRGIPEEAVRELRLLGDLYLSRERHADAATAYVRGAEIASTTGSFRRAMDLFDRAVAADPDNVGVRHAAVAFYIMNGAVDKATQQLREVVRVALQNNDPDEAVAALHQIIGLAPSDASAYHRLGEVLTSMGEYAQAERVYRRLAAFTPDDPVLLAKQSALAALAAGQ
jgi:tetratricopeptide (TPR) repeat protein